MSLPVKKSGGTFTYGDYLTWPDDERWELIEGVPYAMTPAPGTVHQRVLGALHTEFSNYLRGTTCEVFFAPFDVRLPKGDEADDIVSTVVQPDLAVICDRSKLDERGCRGGPDLIVEIQSPSTAQKDMTVKLSLYERAGIGEYWIVHPLDRTVMVFRLLENGQYGRPSTYSEDDEIRVGILDDLTIALKTVFGAHAPEHE
jgi:Uma2 family endonuclease